MCRSQKRKKYSQVVGLFCAFEICASKCCSFKVDEIDPRGYNFEDSKEEKINERH